MNMIIESLFYHRVLATARRSKVFPLLAIASTSILAACTAAFSPLAVDSEKTTKTVSVQIDSAIEYQETAGFGATTLAGIIGTGNGVRDLLNSNLRIQALKAVYDDVGLNLGDLQLSLEPRNDNEDPLIINEDGYRWESSNAMYELLVLPSQSEGFLDYSLGLKIDMRRELEWMKDLRNNDYNLYLREVSEYVTAGVLHWRKISGRVPRLITLFNEPLSGNRELRGGSTQEVVDIIKSVGERLRREGFTETKFIVPAEETVNKTIDTSSAILADKTASSYVGVLAYHAYPYDSAYSSVRRILKTTGNGQPDNDEIASRRRLHQLAAQHGLSVWMTEASEGPGRADYPFGSMENLTARANHIYDEFVYANASAYFAMYNFWDRESHDAHFNERGVDFFSESSHIALVDQRASKVHISGIGFAVGQFARWITPGSVRIDTVSDNKLIKVIAFRCDRRNELVLVIINNSNAEVEINVTMKNMALGGTVRGEFSDAANRWKKLAPLAALDSGSIRLNVGPISVTSLSAPLESSD
jgi:O-glycosyl hydrolase